MVARVATHQGYGRGAAVEATLLQRLRDTLASGRHLWAFRSNDNLRRGGGFFAASAQNTSGSIQARFSVGHTTDGRTGTTARLRSVDHEILSPTVKGKQQGEELRRS